MTRTVRRPAALGVAGVLALGLASCAAEPVPQPRPQPVEGPVAALTADRADVVRAEVSEVLAAADASRDAALLEPRVTGAAAELRLARYRLQGVVGGSPAPAPVGGEVLRDVVPAVATPGAEEGAVPADAVDPSAAAGTFPRTWATVTQAEGQQQPQLSVLVQDDARSPYRLVATAGLLPGAVVPGTATGDAGTPAVDPAALVLPPADAVAAYAAALGTPAAEAGDAGAAVADDAFRQVVSAEETEADALDFFGWSVTRAVREGSVVSVATGDGGALVLGLLDTERVQQLEPGSEGALLRLPADEAALAGAEEAGERTSTTWVEAVALVVPPADAEDTQVRAVAADRVLVAAEAS